MGQGDAKPEKTGKGQSKDIKESPGYKVQKLLLDNVPQQQQVSDQRPTKGELLTGVTRKGNSYEIDVSKFDPCTDLPKLLSEEMEIKYNLSHLSDQDKAKFTKNLSSKKEQLLDDFIKQARTVIKESHNLGITIENETFRDVIMAYHGCSIMLELRKRYPVKSDKFYEDIAIALKDLKDIHRENSRKTEQEKRERFLGLSSNDKVKREIEIERIITQAYYDLWHKYHIEQPNTENFRTHYARAQGIIEISIKDIKPEDHEGFLKNIRDVNQRLRKEVRSRQSYERHDHRWSQSRY